MSSRCNNCDLVAVVVEGMCGVCRGVAEGIVSVRTEQTTVELTFAGCDRPWTTTLSGEEIFSLTGNQFQAILANRTCTLARVWSGRRTKSFEPSVRGLRLAVRALFPRVENQQSYYDWFPTRRQESRRPRFDAEKTARQESDSIDIIHAALGGEERGIAGIVYAFCCVVMHKEYIAYLDAEAEVDLWCLECKDAEAAEWIEEENIAGLDPTPALFAGLEAKQRRLEEAKRAKTAAEEHARKAAAAWLVKLDLARKAHREEDLRVLKRRLDRLATAPRRPGDSDYDSYSDIEEARATKKRKGLLGGAVAVLSAAPAAKPEP